MSDEKSFSVCEEMLPLFRVIQNCYLEPAKTYLSSSDINSLFTNVPLDETIEICDVALSNNRMYKQLDGMAVGSLLGPALANIFVGFHESRLFDNTVKPGVYFRYVDETFVIFVFELDCDHFQEKLNMLHPALRFTVGKE